MNEVFRTAYSPTSKVCSPTGTGAEKVYGVVEEDTDNPHVDVIGSDNVYAFVQLGADNANTENLVRSYLNDGDLSALGIDKPSTIFDESEYPMNLCEAQVKIQEAEKIYAGLSVAERKKFKTFNDFLMRYDEKVVKKVAPSSSGSEPTSSGGDN